jgi:hypothetical protein
VGAVLRSIASHPSEYLVRRWNWKSAITSALLRGSIFFTVNLSAGLDAALAVPLTGFVFRTLTSGSYGAVIQAFRRAEPAWAAALTTIVLLPLCNHLFEFLIHWSRGTPKLGQSILASVIFTIFSTLFNLYVMRRGALVVGKNSRTLRQDLRDMPELIASFLALGPMLVFRFARGLVRERR